jgi:hypothetical protein
VNVAICPKEISTNPGIEWFEVPAGVSIAQAEQNRCFIANPKDRTDNLLKKLAKYKLSTSCSYTPSILAYYHVSRILGGVGRVPPAVIRTFDLERHQDIAEIGIDEAIRKFGSGAVIVKTWKSLASQLAAGASSSKRDALFTDAFDQSYGALQVNPRKEVKYSAMFNEARRGGTRADAFRDYNQVFQLVKSSRPISSLVRRSFTAANVQTVQQMKDSSDLAVIDTLLSQEDRFGNIHAENRYAYIDPADVGSDGFAKVKFKSKMTAQEIAARNAVPVKQMLLKDNDCGVSRTNRAADAGLLDVVAHMDPKTYQGVLYFDSIADDPAVVKSFKTGMMFTSSDFQTMRTNLRRAAASLRARCRSGALKLDLDLDVVFSSRGSVAESCELALPRQAPGLSVDPSVLTMNNGVTSR